MFMQIPSSRHRRMVLPCQLEPLEKRQLLSSVTNISGLHVSNLDGLPSNGRMVYNRISNPDTIRPNVTHTQASVKLINNRSSTINISSIALADSTNFHFVSGSGTNVSIAPGQSRTVTVKFAGSGSGLFATFASRLNIVSGGVTDYVKLAGIWQKYSEQTPTN